MSCSGFSRCLVQLKASSFWKDEIKSACNNSQCVWRTVDSLLGEAKSVQEPAVSPKDYHRFIYKRIDVTVATASADLPMFINV